MVRVATRNRRRPLQLERLDDRLCLTANAVLFDGVLTITGSPRSDVILVSEGADGVVVVRDGEAGKPQSFRGPTRVVVNSLEGDDTIRFNAAGDLPALPVLVLRGGDGDDNVLIGLLLPAVQKVREAAARVMVDLGKGNDQLSLKTYAIGAVSFDLTAGDGDDSILIGLLLPAVQKVREAAARVRINLGEGNDQLGANVNGISQASLDLNAGGGNDAILIGLLLPAVQPMPATAARMNIDLGPGSDNLQGQATGFSQAVVDIAGGDGDDSALIGLLLPAVQKVREAAARMNYNLGAGNDRLQSTATGFSQVSLNFAGGDGNDAALIGLLLPAPQAVPEATALVKFDLGGGANQLQSNVTGYPQTMVDLTAGGGNDSILIGLLLPAVQKVREAAARVNAALGDGNDQFMLRVTGFPTVAIGVDSGIGDDLVALGLLLPDGKPGDGSMAIARVDLGPGADELMWFARGFDTVLTDFALDQNDRLITPAS